MNKGPNATIRLVRRQNHAGTTVFWTTVQREKSSHAYKLSSNVQTACSTDSLNNCPKHSILRFSSFALKIYLWLNMCQHNLPCSIVYAHCLLPGRAFASLYVLLFLEKEAEIGGRDTGVGMFQSQILDLFLILLFINRVFTQLTILKETQHMILLTYNRIRTGLKSTLIYRTFLKSRLKLNLPWKVLEKHSKALRSPWFFSLTGGFNTEKSLIFT